jgi:PAS domain S-box-containing protein
LYGGAGIAILILVVIALYALTESRGAAQSRTELVTQNMARLMEQTYDGLLDTIDVSLQAGADEISRQIDAASLDPQQVTRFLVRQRERISQLAHIRATNEHGDILYGPGIVMPPVNVSDRDYFVQLRDNANRGLFVGRPLLGRINQKWVWSFARRISKADGSFAGVIFASIYVDEIDRMLAQSTLNAGDVATLRDSELGVIARHVFQLNKPIPPGDKKISKSFEAALKADPAQGSYSSGGGSIDDIDRTQSYRRSGKYRYYVNVGIAKTNFLAQWRTEVAIVSVFVLAFALSTLAYARAVSRAWQRHERDNFALRESEQFAAKIADTVPGMLAFWTADLRCAFANESYRTFFDRTESQMHGIEIQQLMGETLFQLNEPFVRAALAGVEQQFERVLTKANGELSHTWAQYCPKYRDGKVEGFIALVTDISEIKKIQAALRVSLSEKEALLKEVHHRVKNNLQVITSLLRMESRRSTQLETKAVLDDMQARIRAMALLHETLYRSGTFASVDLGAYLRQLAVQAFQTLSTSANAIRLDLNLGSVQVTMDQAIPCGLLVNELISNSLKHGFADGESGQVSVELQPLDDGEHWCLRVCDTGKGLLPDFEEKRKGSLGLQLVADLAGQLKGELTIRPQEKGVAFIVNFKAVEPAPLIMPA